ncbi:MAG: hypothetical protein QOH89_3551 [Pseudonocardiales bacterium]|nr:hypothetical protein [Pseudonocardiales bacterium]
MRLAARRRNTGRPTFNGWVRVESSGWYIQVSDFLDEPDAAELLGEDAVWYFAVADWWRRRPAMWLRTERRAWLAEEWALATRAAALVQETTHLRTLRPLPDAAG